MFNRVVAYPPPNVPVLVTIGTPAPVAASTKDSALSQETEKAASAGANPEIQGPPDKQADSAQVAREILVVAERTAASPIDRDVYLVPDTPLSNSLSAPELLLRVPGVTAGPQGQLYLLGQPGVGILVDGRDVPPGLSLRQLDGGRIERIEVMTTPPAQYGASGSGGLINIVLRKRRAPGNRVNATAYVDTRTRTNATFNFSSATDKRNLDAGVGILTSETDVSTVRRLRLPTGAIIDNDTSGRDRVEERSSSLSFVRTFPSWRLESGAQGSRTYSEIDRDIRLANQNSTSDGSSSGRGVTLAGSISMSARITSGSLEGLSSSFQASHLASSDAFSATGLGPSTVSDASGLSLDTLSGQIDYDFKASNVLSGSIGGSLSSVRFRNVIDSTEAEFSTDASGTSRNFALYSSTKTRLGSVGLQAGLRFEDVRYEFDVDGTRDARKFSVWTPSLHAEQGFGRVTVRAAVSRTAVNPELRDLVPQIRRDGPTTGNAGNSSLSDERTTATELSARRKIQGGEQSLTFFRRVSEDVLAPVALLRQQGDLFYSRFNVGTRRVIGTSGSMRGRISNSITFNLSASGGRTTVCTIAPSFCASKETFSFTGLIDIRDREANVYPNNLLSLRLGYSTSPYYGVTELPASIQSSLSVTHAFNPSVAVVVTANQFLGGRFAIAEYNTPEALILQRQLVRTPSLRISLVLLRK